jgi:DNA-binding MarR family transcriptional regulator
MTDHSAEDLRQLLQRHGLAHQRFRAAVARSLGVADADVAALAYVSLAGTRTPTALARDLGFTSGGVAALGQRLRDQGYLSESRDSNDHRKRLLALTPKAVGDLTQRYSPLASALSRLSDARSPEACAAIGDFLQVAVVATAEAAEALDREARERAARDGTLPTPGLWA